MKIGTRPHAQCMQRNKLHDPISGFYSLCIDTVMECWHFWNSDVSTGLWIYIDNLRHVIVHLLNNAMIKDFLFYYIGNIWMVLLKTYKVVISVCMSVRMSDHNSGTPWPICFNLIRELGRTTVTFLAWFWVLSGSTLWANV